MTTQSRELALCLINENTAKFSYRSRRHLAESNRPTPDTVTLWANMLSDYAIHYETQFPGAVFTAVDILAAAAEVAEYYDEHIKE